jgi:hypothetical protein
MFTAVMSRSESPVTVLTVVISPDALWSPRHPSQMVLPLTYEHGHCTRGKSRGSSLGTSRDEPAYAIFRPELQEHYLTLASRTPLA